MFQTYEIPRLPNYQIYLSSVVPHFLQTRTLRSPRTSCPMRTGPQVGQTSATFESGIGPLLLGDSALDVALRVRAHVFLHHHHVLHQHLPSSGNTRSTRPSFPVSRPVITFTVSFRRISLAYALSSLQFP